MRLLLALFLCLCCGCSDPERELVVEKKSQVVSYVVKDGVATKKVLYRFHKHCHGTYRTAPFWFWLDVDEETFNMVKEGDVVRGTWKY